MRPPRVLIFLALTACGPDAAGESTVPEPVHYEQDLGRAKAVYAPDPKQSLLQKTNAAVSGLPGRCVVRSCIGSEGKVTESEVVEGFPGDADVDEICKDTVRKWRFKPHTVDEVPTPICTHAVFSMTFTGGPPKEPSR